MSMLFRGSAARGADRDSRRLTDQVETGLPEPPEKGASAGAAFKAVTQASRGRRAPAAIVVAAIAVLIVALLTKGTAPATGLRTASTAPRPSLAEVVTSLASPTAVPGSWPVSVPPGRNPSVTPHPTLAAGPAEGGTIELIPAGSTPVRLWVTLPAGWQQASDAMFVKSNRVATDEMSISAWHLLHVDTFPCRWAAQVFADEPLMRSAQGQAEALSSWWGQDPTLLPYWNSKIAPLASKPTARTMQGYAAWSLDVLIPSDFDFTACDGGQLILWDTGSGVVRSSRDPGEVHGLRVVDVSGEIIVIDATSFLSTSPADAAELQGIVESVVIER
jgi:hypothetical protein